MPRLAKPVHVETILPVCPPTRGRRSRRHAPSPRLLDRGKLVLVQAPWDA
jgi:hypothetical protein